MRKLLFFVFLLLISSKLSISAQNILHARVIDAERESPIVGAYISDDSIGKVLAVTDADGHFTVSARPSQKLFIRSLGYRTLVVKAEANAIYKMKIDPHALKEVVVTAREGKGAVTKSVIARDAMNLLQPNSIADIMELLPGGYAKDPNMGQMNSIALRETGTMGATGELTMNNKYAISSLGTGFIVDGAPINTDANLQYSPLADTQSATSTSSVENLRNTTNRGVDMRTIGTDDIENIEVVRGIPSVEYGNLTSGIVNIKKIRCATPLTLRFKADGFSKLLSLGKGFALGKPQEDIINIDLGYLDSKTDPTDNLENYKRLTASLRYTLKRNHKGRNILWNAALDYAGSFDDSKADPDLNFGRIDEYRSDYNRIALTNNLNITRLTSWLSAIELNTSLSLQIDRLKERRLVAPQRYGIVPSSSEEGEQEAAAVFSEYMADYRVDGKPITAYAKAKAMLAPIDFDSM